MAVHSFLVCATVTRLSSCALHLRPPCSLRRRDPLPSRHRYGPLRLRRVTRAFCFAHRAFCARLIFLRAAADVVPFLRPATAFVPVPFMYTLPNAVRAAVTRCS
jgi:hypothetical protein